jgi:4-hydroxyphenylpyruvate dioxygenase
MNMNMNMNVRHLLLHFMRLPSQGDPPIAGFMGTLAATDDDGWLSHEIFNDWFRMASPRQIAEDGARSLIHLTGRTPKGAALPPAPPTEGVVFLEFAVAEKNAAGLGDLFRAMAFARTGRHKSKVVERMSQGGINLAINSDPDGFAHAYDIAHGRSVAAVGLWIGHASAQMDRAEALLAQSCRQKVGPGELAIPVIRGVGGSLI